MGLDAGSNMQSAATLLMTSGDVPEQYATVGQGWLWRPRGHSASMDAPASKLQSQSSISNSKSSKKRRNLRKSLSDRPLAAVELPATAMAPAASLQDVALDEPKPVALTASDVRRQAIVAKAEEIMKGKQCVGILDGATCPVCLMDDVDTQLQACGHLLHAKCIARWMATSARCPVCREDVTDVVEVYSTPADVALRPMEKDQALSLTHSSDATCLTPDDERDGDDGFGWFEDFDEFDELNDDASDGLLFSDRRSLPTFPTEASAGAPQLLLNRQLSTTFEVCRTFQPLRAGYDTPYQSSRHEWLRALASHRHIAAKIQIRSFRIVESKSSGDRHAEYLIELQLDGRLYVSKWRRFSEIARFVNGLNSTAYRQALEAWAPIEAESRWFNRLELSYLHQRCRMLEEFAHALLLECSNAHKLADFVECC